MAWVCDARQKKKKGGRKFPCGMGGGGRRPSKKLPKGAVGRGGGKRRSKEGGGRSRGRGEGEVGKTFSLTEGGERDGAAVRYSQPQARREKGPIREGR